MTHVDRVATGQIRDPETFLVLMKSNDWLLHLVSTPRAGCLWPIADAVGAVCDRAFRQERRALTRPRLQWLLGGRNLQFLADLDLIGITELIPIRFVDTHVLMR